MGASESASAMQARRVQLELIGWLQAAVAFSGFPVQLESVLDFQSTGLSRHFTDLASLRELCSRSVIWSWSSWDFASSKLHESQEIVKKAIRDAEVLQQTIRTCPPLAMKLMLLFLEHFFMHGILEEGLQEANQVHVTFNKVKAWLLYEALPQEDPEEVLAGWDLAGTEAKVFNHYKNLWRAVYSRDAAQRDGEADAPDFIAMAIEENRQGRKGRSETFYKMCPQAEPAELVSVLEAKGATLVEGAMPTKMRLIGNSLSVYWQARGLAELLGAAFMTSSGQESAGRFTDFLPRTSRQKEAWRNSSKELDIACRACPTREDWRWPHSCLGSWFSALPLVRAETRRALRKSGAEAAVSKFLLRHDVLPALQQL
ncbi:unnamed protein product [Effrenium voratum]|uniref:Uncharacterized protein n=1 Tax=Effrenium voratum TaxID=2562239 RepID=A0AA36I4L6_9DINO|nr:unnamed protein product [Effrenium voratum]